MGRTGRGRTPPLNQHIFLCSTVRSCTPYMQPADRPTINPSCIHLERGERLRNSLQTAATGELPGCCVIKLWCAARESQREISICARAGQAGRHRLEEGMQGQGRECDLFAGLPAVYLSTRPRKEGYGLRRGTKKAGCRLSIGSCCAGMDGGGPIIAADASYCIGVHPAPPSTV